MAITKKKTAKDKGAALFAQAKAKNQVFSNVKKTGTATIQGNKLVPTGQTGLLEGRKPSNVGTTRTAPGTATIPPITDEERANALLQSDYAEGKTAEQKLFGDTLGATTYEEAQKQKALELTQQYTSSKLAGEEALKAQNYSYGQAKSSMQNGTANQVAGLYAGGREGPGSESNVSAANSLTQNLASRTQRLDEERNSARSNLAQAEDDLNAAYRDGRESSIAQARSNYANAEMAVNQIETDLLNAQIEAESLMPETEAGAAFDKDLTTLINDGYLYKLDDLGVPTRVLDSTGAAVVTAKEEKASTLDFTPPKQDAFGNIVSPGYLFDKSTGALQIIDTQTGAYTDYATGTEAQNASQVFSNFDGYISQTGNGSVVAGSPYHKGLEMDIDGAVGDPILSFTTGTVESMEGSCKPGDRSCGGGFGNNVVIRMSDGTSVRYAHLDTVNLSVGQSIYSGNLIGEMGNTGQVIGVNGGDGSHLHIEAKGADGNLIALSDLDAGSTLTFKAGEDLNSLRAEAFAAGYITDAEVMGYMNAKKYGITPPNRTEQDMTDTQFSQSNTFRDEFNNLQTVKDFKTIRDSAQTVRSLIDMGTSGAGDVGIIYSFMKALDPTSVVREAEYDTGQYKGGNIFAGAFAGFKGLFNEQGGFVSDSAKQNFMAALTSLYDVKQKAFQSEYERYNALANNFDLDPTFVTYDYSSGISDVLSPEVSPSFNLTDVASGDIAAGAITQEEINQLYSTPEGKQALIDAGYITQ